MTEADRQLQQADLESSSCPAYAWFFLALAHHRLDRLEQAQQWFEKAVQWKTRYLAEDAHDNTATILWNRQATLELLEKEVRALMRGVKLEGGFDRIW